MIRIDRGPEPDALTLARDEHLARARLRGTSPEAIVGYQDARSELSERQLYKCAYCELTTRHEAAPVEHYRPKAKAQDVVWTGLAAVRQPSEADGEDDRRFARGLPPRRDGFTRVRWSGRTGYWWLAWTWENLVFGCSGCNSGVKLSRFPREASTPYLNEHKPPPGQERPLLLDPADLADDPVDHIRYRRVFNRWLPTPREGSKRGAWTIALLRLDSSPALLTAYDGRVRHLDGRSRALESIRASGDTTSIRVRWQALGDDVLASNEPLLGLTYDWLDTRYPEPWRREHGVSLAKPVLRVPGLGPAVPARPAVAPIAALEGLPPELCDLIRVARNYRALAGTSVPPSIEHKPLPELITDILAHRPSASDEQLGELLNRKPATIRRNRER